MTAELEPYGSRTYDVAECGLATTSPGVQDASYFPIMRLMDMLIPHSCRSLRCLMRRMPLVIAVVCCLWLAACPASHAQVITPQQSPQSPPAGMPNPNIHSRITAIDPAEQKFEHKIEAAQVSERLKHIQADTRTLLQLATELQIAVDKTDRDQLSLDVIRKAEQIEKLAKSVKEKMRQE